MKYFNLRIVGSVQLLLVISVLLCPTIVNARRVREDNFKNPFASFVSLDEYLRSKKRVEDIYRQVIEEINPPTNPYGPVLRPKYSEGLAGFFIFNVPNAETLIRNWIRIKCQEDIDILRRSERMDPGDEAVRAAYDNVLKKLNFESRDSIDYNEFIDHFRQIESLGPLYTDTNTGRKIGRIYGTTLRFYKLGICCP